MKIKSIAAVGALGVGLGVASFIGGTGTASAVPNPPPGCGESPIGLTPANLICNVQSQGSSFAMSVSPAYNAQVLLYGTQNDNGTPSGLGLVDQLSTFQSSLQDFASGPQSPGGPPPAAPPH